MAGGRPTKGLEHIDKLDVAEDVKERVRAILQTINGELSVKEAAALLDVGESRFHQLRDEFLAAGCEGLQPKAKGRPAVEADPRDEHIDELERRIGDLEVELQAARVREEIALAMPHALEKEMVEAQRQELKKKLQRRKKQKEQRKQRRRQRRIAKKM